MEQKKAMLQALIASMRKKMLDGEGDTPMEPGEALEESGEENKEDLSGVLATEEKELAEGKDLDGDGKPGDAELVAAIKKYMSGDNGGAGMKVGPVFGASSSVSAKPTASKPNNFKGKK
jgi:hypothetical protein